MKKFFILFLLACVTSSLFSQSPLGRVLFLNSNGQQIWDFLPPQSIQYAAWSLTGNDFSVSNPWGITNPFLGTISNHPLRIYANNTERMVIWNTGTTGGFGLNGGNFYISFWAPATLSANLDFTFPNSYGSANQALVTDGSGGLSWMSVPIINGFTTNGQVPRWNQTNSWFEPGIINDWNNNVSIGDANNNVITLGNSLANDQVIFTSTINSNFIPTSANTYALGSSSNYWSSLYVSGSSVHLMNGANDGTISATPSAARTWTLPDATGTIALLENAQTWTATQTFSAVGNGIVITTNADFQGNIANSGGNVTVNDNLVVTGTSDLQGAVSNSTANNSGRVYVNDDFQVTGNSFFDGDVTLGNANTDNVVFNADVNSNILPNSANTYNLGSSTQYWQSLYVSGSSVHLMNGANDGTITASPTAARTWTLPDASGTVITTGNLTDITAVGTIASGTWQGTAIADAYVANNLTISGGTIDNSVIGGTTPAAGTFTNLTANDNVILGSDASDNVVFNADVNSNIIPNSANTYNLGSSTQYWQSLYVSGSSVHLMNGANDGTITASPSAARTWTLPDTSGTVITTGNVSDIPSGAIAPNQLNITNNNLLVGNASNQGSLLAPGSNGQVLAVSGGAPTWTTLSTLETDPVWTAAISANTNITGNWAFQNNLTIGSDASDNVVFNADVNSNIIPNSANTYNLGSSTQYWRSLYVSGSSVHLMNGANDGTITASPTAARTWTLPDASGTVITTGNLTDITAVGTIASGTWQGTAIADAYVANNLTISGGTIDNSVIGGTTPAAGTFTNLTATGTVTLPNNSITDAMVVNALTINGGTIDNSVIGGTTPAAGTFTTLTVNNTVGTNAISVTNGGGDVKLSYEALNVAGNAVTINNDVSVAFITSDDDGNQDAITTPTGTNGKFLFVVVYDPTGNNDNVSIAGQAIARTNAYMNLTLVYANGGWRVVSVYQHN